MTTLMSNVNFMPRETGSANEVNISKALSVVPMEGIEQSYVEFSKFLGGALEHEVIPFTNGGIKLMYQTQDGMSGMNQSAPTPGMVFADADNQMNFDNLILRQSHLITTTSAGQYDQFTADLITTPEELAAFVVKIANDALKDETKVTDINFGSGPQGIVGEIVAVLVGAAVTLNTANPDLRETVDPFGGTGLGGGTAWTGYYPVTLRLGGHTNQMVFQTGRDLHVCAPPAGWTTGTQTAAITASRNWSVPGRVLGMLVESPTGINPSTGVFDGAAFTVTLAFPFSVSTGNGAPVTEQATVATAVGTIAAGDVITLWGKNFTAAGVAITNGTFASGGAPIGGPNHGTLGLPFWFGSGDVDAFALNSQPFQCEIPIMGQFTSISRGQSAFSYLVPQALASNLDSSGKRQVINWGLLDTITSQTAYLQGDKPMGANRTVVMHPFNLTALIGTQGSDKVRMLSELTREREKWFQKYGFSGGVYQSVNTAEPINIATTRACTLDRAYCMDPSQIRRIMPKPAHWLANANGGYIHPVTVTGSSGGETKLTNRYRVLRVSYQQMIMREIFKQGGMTGIKPF
jgi:hypothetical protein